MATVRWLHLSDLHIGNHLGTNLWSTFRESFYMDIRRLLAKIGPIHFVLFTGDLVQSGDEAEYSALSRELEGLWKVLESCGSCPTLFTVPGNHDLKRPNPKEPMAKLLARWHEDPDVSAAFWEERDSPYRQLVERAFSEYVKWSATPPVPTHAGMAGIIPGDSSAIVNIDGFRLGLIGLNSAFLQLSDGNYEGHLDVSESQLLSVTNQAPDDWTKNNHANLLITHHPPTWIERLAHQRYRSEIYPPRRFTAHLFGHMHFPTTEVTSEGGAVPRRMWQAPSLLGLRKFHANVKDVERSHGYWVGAFTEVAQGVELRLWPREGRQGNAGDWRLVADSRFDLDEAQCMTEIVASALSSQPSRLLNIGKLEQSIPTLLEINSKNLIDSHARGIGTAELLRDEPSTDLQMHTLANQIPIWNLHPQVYHRQIRISEQQRFLSFIQNDHRVWLVADWGLGKEGFLWACLYGTEVPSGASYRIDCEDADTVEAIREAAAMQMRITLQQLGGALATVDRPVLVLDNISSTITSSASACRDLEHLAAVFLDYVPGASIVLSAREKPTYAAYGLVLLQPLDEAECGRYIADHPDGGRGLVARRDLERIYARSEGIPMHLDDILVLLRTVSIDELPVIEQNVNGEHREPIPRALVKSIEQITASGQKYASRTVRLLKVLSVLSAGETYARIQRFYPTEPFWHENVNILCKSGLIEALPIVELIEGLSTKSQQNSEASAQKLLVASRPVRDYVMSMITPDELEAIIEKAMDLYFGERWKEYKPHLARLPPSANAASSGRLGNPHRVVVHLMRRAIQGHDSLLLSRAVSCAVAYVKMASNETRFRETLLAIEELVSILESSGHIRETAPFLVNYALGLRMAGEYQRSADIIEKALRASDDEDLKLQGGTRERLYIELSFARRALGERDAAVIAARKAIEVAKPDTASAIQAEGIVVELQLTGVERKKQLAKLEEKARNQDSLAVANNIALAMARLSADLTERREHRDRVLSSRDKDYYNFTRALVQKAHDLVSTGNINQITASERRALERAYAYLFTQRLGVLFDTCHDVLWSLAAADKQTNILLRIFRHSSFLWRLFGKDAHERGYLGRLEPVVPSTDLVNSDRLEVVYYLTRLRTVKDITEKK